MKEKNSMSSTDQASSQAAQLSTQNGKTSIEPVVVAKIAARAAREVNGVHELVGSGFGGTVAGFAEQVTGAAAPTTGVNVNVANNQATISVTMTVDYGVSIPQVADAVRNNIINRVQSMTGLSVQAVNIGVTDLYVPQPTAQQQAQQAGQQAMAH
jgi:uncharacterized alkaline shock family protein YloU